MQGWLSSCSNMQHIEGQPKKKRLSRICKWKEGGGCTERVQHKCQGFCKHHHDIWFRRHRINNNEALNNTATGGGGVPLINHGTVGWTDNCLLSGTGDNDVSLVARGNTATGGGTLPNNNEMLSRTENCLPSSNDYNEVSLAACGNTDISQKKRGKVSALQMDRRRV